MWLEINGSMHNMDVYKRVYVDGSTVTMIDHTVPEDSKHRLRVLECADIIEANKQYEILKRLLQRG